MEARFKLAFRDKVSRIRSAAKRETGRLNIVLETRETTLERSTMISGENTSARRTKIVARYRTAVESTLTSTTLFRRVVISPHIAYLYVQYAYAFSRREIKNATVLLP